MIWNVRDESIAWVAELTKIIYVHEKGALRFKSGEWRKAFESTKLFEPLRTAFYGYEQKGPAKIIVDRAMSISFIAALPHPEKNTVRQLVEELLATHPETKGKTEIILPNHTELYWCESTGH